MPTSKKVTLPSKSLKEKAKKLGIRLTTNSKGKKSSKVLREQVNRKSKKKFSFGSCNRCATQKINFDKSHTPGIPSLIMPGSYGLGVGYYGTGSGITRG